jgi:tetratricopeptide (TPR) repeat protein
VKVTCPWDEPREILCNAGHADKHNISSLDDKAKLWMTLFTHGQYAEIEEIHRESIDRLDAEDSKRLSFENNLGSMYFKLQKYAKARNILHSTLEKMQQQNHPHTLICKRNLAWTFIKLGNSDTAKTLIQEVIASLNKTQSSEELPVLEGNNMVEELKRIRERSSKHNNARSQL